MAKKEEAQKEITLLSTVDHDGESHGPGTDLKIPASQADALIKAGAAKEKAAESKKDADKK